MDKNEIKKKERKINLFKVISEKKNKTQDDLVDALREKGINVTQATVSRDLNEYKIVKDAEGYYVLAEGYEKQLREDEFADVFRKYAQDVSQDVQLVGVRVRPGFAHPLALEIEKMGWNEVIGSLWSDELLLIAIDRQGSEAIPLDEGTNRKAGGKNLANYLSTILNQN